MAIALALQEYLDDRRISYDVTSHEKTVSSAATAQAVQVPADKIAKGVILKSDDLYVLAVLPASRRLDLRKARKAIGESVVLATEDEASMLFPDCDKGAVPAVGAAYNVASIVDERLDHRDEVYFEGGDHRSLVHVGGEQFDQLMYGIPHARLSA